MSKKSIISLHSGQAGCQAGWEIWKLYCMEHNIDMDGTRNIDLETIGADIDNFQTFFYETSSGKYVPKCIFIDSEPSVMDALRASALGKLVHDVSLINGKQECRNVMGLAWNPSFCPQVHEQLPNAIRRMRECSDVLSGYMYFLSGCGGSGPGFTCKALQTIRNSEPKSINHSYVLLPSPTISLNPMEIYNAITYLGLIRYDNLYMNVNTIFDNEALYRQSIQLSGQENFVPTYQHLNQLISVSMSSATASIRWDGQLNVDMEDFQVNLVPYPTMHHVFHTYSPINNNEQTDRARVVDLTLQAFRPQAHCVSLNCLAQVQMWPEEEKNGTWQQPVWMGEHEENVAALQAEGKPFSDKHYQTSHAFIGCCLMYRGDVMPVKVNQAMRVLNSTYNPYFVSWVPNGFKVGINTPPVVHPENWVYRNTSRSLTGIVNSTVIMEKLKQMVRDYRLMTDRKGYDLWYENGFEKELVSACKNGLVDLIGQYEAAMSRKMAVQEMRIAMAQRPNPCPHF